MNAIQILTLTESDLGKVQMFCGSKGVDHGKN